MRKLRALWFRLLGMFGAHDGEAEFATELENDIAMRIEDGVRIGLSREEARRRVLIQMGGIAQTQQAYRERRGLPVLEKLVQDVGYGARMLLKNPGFTLVAVLTLALGIGANTALFSVVNGVLLNPLPYPHPEELVTVHESKQNFSEGSISYLNFRDWQRDNKTLSALAVARPTGYNMTGQGDAEEVAADLVSSDFFPLLGVKPALGRLFAPKEDEIGRGPVVLLSAGLWKRKFGSRPEVLGRALTLDGRDYTIVGVLPESFNLTINNFRPTDLYVPIGQFQNPALKDRAAGLGIHGIARLRSGVTLEQAQEDMARLSERLEKEFPQDDGGIRARLVPFRYAMVRNVQPLLLILFGAVGFVLLIACVNVANLLLARSSVRTAEFAVRSALGAGRGRLIRQLLTESAMLSLAGGALGLLIAGFGTKAALKLVPQDLPRAGDIHISAGVLCFTLFVSLASGIFFGLAPALNTFRQNLVDTLREGGRGTSGSRHRVQDTLVIVQMALALVLLAGAGLVIRSMMKLSEINPGFRPEGVLTLGVQAPPSVGSSEDRVRAYLREVERTIAATPGVQAVSLSWGAVPMGSDDETLFWLDGEPKPTSENAMHWSIRYIVGSGYLKAMGVPLLRGRFLADADDQHSPRVVVVDDVFAHKFFGNEDPIGKRIHLDNFDAPAVIVGVVGHVNQWGLDLDATNSLRAETYQPILQLPPVQLSLVPLGMQVFVRSSTDGASTFRAIQSSLARMSREQVAYNPETMDAMIADLLASRRFSMILLSVFAATALLLASVGMYGVISYVVSQRTQEIGVRMALGADRSRVLRWVIEQGGRLAILGACAGLAAALALTQVMAHSSLLYGVSAYDPWTMGVVTALLLLVAIAACCVPAWRATRIDPMRALRME
ncbi:putative permease [Silvibacterium bohemicum]|uniref:Putative permease n=1 Tax=Silvibacterium bohemicum TaxID=1577686 RepID=A0A841JXE7_9BACT|nr:ABC transporter permease [Silvibacterium bohemicum]MBB6146032.1 putative permease [Silvibacterium bohemicum]